jgi:hypothetical protein
MLPDHTSAERRARAALAARHVARLRTVACARRLPATGTDDPPPSRRRCSTAPPRPITRVPIPHPTRNEGTMTKHAFPLGRLATLTLALMSALAVAITVATLAVNHARVTGTDPATQPIAQRAHTSDNIAQRNATPRTPDIRFDGGPEEGTRGTAASQWPSTRFDGGPDKSTRGTATLPTSSTRFDGGPEEGTRGSRH